MHIEFLVEELSAEAALQNLALKILGENVSFAIHAHQGKLDLLRKLPGQLRGYKTWLPDDWCIVILIDEDRQDCGKLKRKLEQETSKAGLITRLAARADAKISIRQSSKSYPRLSPLSRW